MPPLKTTTVSNRGLVVLPAKLRRRYGLESGSLVTIEERDGGLLLRPAVAVPVEIYSDEERAAFLLSNAIGEADYARAGEAVRRMGLDPATVPHVTPGETRRIAQQAGLMGSAGSELLAPQEDENTPESLNR